jgi:hypothetical protein
MQNRPSRQLWLAAAVVSLICIGALAWALINDWNTPPESTTIKREGTGGGSGFGLGLMIGLGVGIALGSVLALRKRQS